MIKECKKMSETDEVFNKLLKMIIINLIIFDISINPIFDSQGYFD